MHKIVKKEILILIRILMCPKKIGFYKFQIFWLKLLFFVWKSPIVCITYFCFKNKNIWTASSNCINGEYTQTKKIFRYCFKLWLFTNHNNWTFGFIENFFIEIEQHKLYLFNFYNVLFSVTLQSNCIFCFIKVYIYFKCTLYYF